MPTPPNGDTHSLSPLSLLSPPLCSSQLLPPFPFPLLSQVSRVLPTVYALTMNNTQLQLEAHKMSDGSLLLSLHGSSYTTYMKAEADGYRVVIGGKTCVFEKENDPRVLR